MVVYCCWMQQVCLCLKRDFRQPNCLPHKHAYFSSSWCLPLMWSMRLLLFRNLLGHKKQVNFSSDWHSSKWSRNTLISLVISPCKGQTKLPLGEMYGEESKSSVPQKFVLLSGKMCADVSKDMEGFRKISLWERSVFSFLRKTDCPAPEKIFPRSENNI